MVSEPISSYWEHWYEVAEGTNLRQGDIFRSLVVYWLPDDLQTPGLPTEDALIPIAAKWLQGDWIVLDASCDLDQKLCPQVLLAPVRPATAETLKTGTDDKQLTEG